MTWGRHAVDNTTSADETGTPPAWSGEDRKGHHYQARGQLQSSASFWTAIGLLALAFAGQGYFLHSAWEFWHMALDLMELYLRLAKLQLV